ncbi:FMN-dependent oxidoreductase, nitrilotriacetate monooxygenase family [Parafrankia irregularis]|uniref:FMN-dependent oxidoreductase, nitrilotriacetate monooxygenase family n=1 Tax=Parafrankia irregularis TaxID=795642 RepID=A0A0S4QWG9_9ACTN|nr:MULTISPECIES: NtaA/DmoA family FMN-dependent monooxygenase [Parafrankia]MBE3205824.1 NtaA/DmoA family FMN-dependent monooxygenase [Parafrankia sp. CH37]CUU59700.1 FMN-dependent oxidoreductase, nitrilotriacetate monooxygenase family [Parafrankia irregularis]
MSKPRKQIILGAYLAGVNHHTVWSDPAAGSQIAFSSFQHLAQTAERGKFDFFFLAEGLALRERFGAFLDTDVVGRPDTLPVLAALAAVTEHLGLVGTVSATFNEPYELARQLASLDHLSDGRVGWNVVTSLDTFTGRNFRRGGFLQAEDRYVRAEEFLDAARALWDSWPADAVAADRDRGRFLRDGQVGRFARHGRQFDIAGRFTVPRSPQGRPVILQAGVSPQGRDFAAAGADAIFSPYHSLPEAQEFYRDITARVAAAGRPPGSVRLLPAALFVLGDTASDARERAREIARAQVSGRTAQILLETVWNRDLSGYDPDGPLPDVEPDTDGPPAIEGRTRRHGDAHATVKAWRELAEANGYSLRELAIHLFARAEFVGTPTQVADRLDEFVQNDGSDGFILGSHLTPTGLDEFVDKVVPLLQERGSLRTEYEGTTLRANLGLPAIPGPAIPEAVGPEPPIPAAAIPAAAIPGAAGPEPARR